MAFPAGYLCHLWRLPPFWTRGWVCGRFGVIVAGGGKISNNRLITCTSLKLYCYLLWHREIKGVALVDLRIKKTYKALAGAFTRLLSQRPYEDISVAALCDAATIRRTTFYKHFKDKDDFFAFFIRSLRLGMTVGETGLDQPGVKPDAEPVERDRVIRELAEFLVQHELMMDNVVKSTASGTLFEVIGENLAKAVRARYRAYDDDAEMSGSLDVAAEFAAGGITRLLRRWWMASNKREELESFVRAADELVGFAMDGVVAR